VFELKNFILSNKRILIVVFFTGLIIGTFYFSLDGIQSQTEQKIHESLILSSLEKQQEIAKRISSHISSDLELISDKIALTTTKLSNEDYTSNYALGSLEKLYSNLNLKTVVGFIFILDEYGTGVSLVNSDGARITTNPPDLSFRDYFTHTQTTLEPYFTNGFVGIEDETLIIVAHPILDVNGKFSGLIAAALDTNEFFKQYGNIDDPNSELLLIIGNDKKFITHPNPQFFITNVFAEESLDHLDSKGIEIFENMFIENSSFGEYTNADHEKIANAQAVMIDGKPQYYVFLTAFVDGIYQQTDVILEQEKFFTFLIILFSVFGAGIMIFVFEKYKMKEQEQKDAKLITIGELSARLAHDLRNPLSIIQISMENLKSLYGADNKKQSQFEKVERSIDRIVHQVDGVLNFVKEQPPHLTKSKISEIISESLDSLTIPNRIKLILPKNNVELLCDKKQFSVAMNNLILNGIQAIKDVGTIKITVEDYDNTIVIQVKDSGMGISKKDLKNIFEPLYTTKQEGTGLGLASVKSIIESHGGTISVTSSPTIFRITLPKISDSNI